MTRNLHTYIYIYTFYVDHNSRGPLNDSPISLDLRSLRSRKTEEQRKKEVRALEKLPLVVCSKTAKERDRTGRRLRSSSPHF